MPQTWILRPDSLCLYQDKLICQQKCGTTPCQMTKAVVMQVTDIKNRRQDMNTRQFLFTAADSIRHLIRAVRTLPKTWLVVFLATCLAAHALPAVAAPEHAAPIQVITDHTTPEQQSGTPPAQWQVASNTGSGPVTAAGAVTTSAVEPVSPQQAPPPGGLSIPGLTTGLHTAAPPAGGLFFLLFYGSEDYEEWSSSTALVSLDQQYFPMAAEIIPAASRTMDASPSARGGMGRRTLPASGPPWRRMMAFWTAYRLPLAVHIL